MRSQTPKACTKHVQEMEECLTEHHVHERVDALDALTSTHGLTDCLKKKWEGVDQDILRASLDAEKRVAKRHVPPWSKTLHQAALRATCWKIALLGRRAHRTVETILEVLDTTISPVFSASTKGLG
jgi:hypothetical protein